MASSATTVMRHGRGSQGGHGVGGQDVGHLLAVLLQRPGNRPARRRRRRRPRRRCGGTGWGRRRRCCRRRRRRWRWRPCSSVTTRSRTKPISRLTRVRPNRSSTSGSCPTRDGGSASAGAAAGRGPGRRRAGMADGQRGRRSLRWARRAGRAHSRTRRSQALVDGATCSSAADGPGALQPGRAAAARRRPAPRSRAGRVSGGRSRVAASVSLPPSRSTT